MKTNKQLAEYIFDFFRVARCKAGHIVMMRNFRHKSQRDLNPKEQEKVVDVANMLVDNGYITYEDPSHGIECLRLTQKGYDYIYDENKPLEGFDVLTKQEQVTIKSDSSMTASHSKAKNSKTSNISNSLKSKPIYKIFVSSTYKDLMEERIKVMSTIVTSGHLPIGMEQFPAAPIEAWDYIKLLIDNADYYLLLLAGKYGSIHPDTGKSYTEMEYEYAKEKGVPVIFFTYHDVNKLTFDKCESDPAVRDKLESFRKEASKNLRQTWSTIDELAYKVKDSLDKTIELFPRIGWVRADSINPVKEDKLELDLNESITFTPTADPFLGEQISPISITLREILVTAGMVLKDFCQPPSIKDALSKIANIDYNDVDTILERLLFHKVIERGEINNEYEGCYKVWSFTDAGLKLYLRLKYGNTETENSIE